MRKLFLITILFFFIIFNFIINARQVESFGYWVKGNTVYYTDLEIIDADPDSFENIPSSYLYGKDKNSVYFWGSKIPDADPKTFKYLAKYYFSDKNSVYFLSTKILGADLETFKVLELYYSLYRDSVFYKEKKIDGADPKTFNYIDDKNFFDKNFKYKILYSTQFGAYEYIIDKTPLN